MDRTRRLVNEYARANGYEITVDFRQKKRIFSKDGLTIGEDEIVGSRGFAGFCDGYENRPHRYKGPAGTPEKSASDFLSPIAEALSLSVSEELGGEFRSAVESAMTRSDYNEQYKLGRNCSR